MTYPGLPEAERDLFEQRRQEMLSNAPEALKASSLMEGKNPGNSFSAEAKSAIDGNARDSTGRRLRRRCNTPLPAASGLYLEGVTKWCGFDWRTNVALLSGFAAKELIISTLGTAYSLGGQKRAKIFP